MESNSEIFKPITGFENYLVSNLGRVYNIKLKRYLKPGFITKDTKYTRVVLSEAGKSYYMLLHRLVATEFCIKSDNSYNVVHHIDNDPSNNKSDNLVWCNQSYNVSMAYKDGLIPDRTGYNNPNHRSKK